MSELGLVSRASPAQTACATVQEMKEGSEVGQQETGGARGVDGGLMRRARGELLRIVCLTANAFRWVEVRLRVPSRSNRARSSLSVSIALSPLFSTTNDNRGGPIVVCFDPFGLLLQTPPLGS
jgi:hypothetical protein